MCEDPSLVGIRSVLESRESGHICQLESYV